MIASGPLLLLEKCDQNVLFMPAVVKISCHLHCRTLWKEHLALQQIIPCSELIYVYSLHVLQKLVLELYNAKAVFVLPSLGFFPPPSLACLWKKT